jgi:flagellar motor switch protein FliG
LATHEVDAICAEMAKMEIVPLELQQQLLEEFSPVAVEAGTAIRGGLEITRTSLERAMGQFKANQVISRVAPARPPVAAVDGITDLEPRQLYNLLCTEEPQTIAMVLSYLPPERAAELSAFFPPPKRDQIIERLATLAPIPVEVVEKVVDVLRTKAGVRQTRALNQSGGVKTAADILNAMGKSRSRESLQNLERRNPDLAKAIQKNMFIFEDLKGIEPGTLQRALRDIDARDLALALKTASEALRTAILGCMSKRAAEGVREEITFLTAVKPRDIDAAQQRIIEAVKAVSDESDLDPAAEAAAEPEAPTPETATAKPSEVQHVTA